MAAYSDLVPVTVIGGYLGAGKTTLINRLLAGDHGRRLAVLVNDFGAINIDVALIASHDGETISLENGCVCCSIADALGDGLDRVLALDPPPDQILIEASGVADPAKIAAYGQGWPGCRLDTVLVLADAELVRTQATDQFVGQLVTGQLRPADLVLLSKCDLLDQEALDATTHWIRTATDAPILEIHNGQVDPALILDLVRPLDDNGTPNRAERLAGPTGPSAEPAPEAEHLFHTEVIPLSGPLSRHDLHQILEQLPDTVVRVKGAVLLQGEAEGKPTRHIVQGVGRRMSIEPMITTSDLDHDPGSLVVIAVQGL